MFTGIIQGIAPITKSQKKQGSLFLTIAKPAGWKLKPGDSVAVNGACLTVQKIAGSVVVFELMPATLRLTTFGSCVPLKVNLERPLKAGDTLGGHFVTGHIDTVGKVVEVRQAGNSRVVKVSYPNKFFKLVVAKGSAAIDGVSLTVAACGRGWLAVALVSYTLAHTNFGKMKVGDRANIEFDILGKYITQYAPS